MDCTYYRVRDDVMSPGRWHLGEPTRGVNVVRGNEFTWAAPLTDTTAFEVQQYRPGQPLDWTYAAFGAPIVRRDLARAIEDIAEKDVQRIPVRVAGDAGVFDILNVLGVADCLDLRASRVAYWSEDDLPELAGTIYSVDDPVIDPARVGVHQIFRFAGWSPPIIVGECIAQLLREASGIALERLPCTGSVPNRDQSTFSPPVDSTEPAS
jgi:hypothetical protein